MTARNAHAVVSWNSPAEEVAGLARYAAALVRRGAATPPQIGFAAPNRTWALQLQQACATEGLPAVVTRTPLDAGMRRCPIMDFRTAWGGFAHLFAVGCVEGLVPTAAALEDEAALEDQRAAFERLTGAAPAVTVSTFAMAEAALADQIRLPYRRTKMIGATPFARVAPSRFIAELGAARPSTIGGQQLLRDAGLN